MTGLTDAGDAGDCSLHAVEHARTGGFLHEPVGTVGGRRQVYLVGEGAGHDEGRVAGGAAQVEQAALGQHDDAVAIGEDEAVHLGLDVLPLDACGATHHLNSVKCCPAAAKQNHAKSAIPSAVASL